MTIFTGEFDCKVDVTGRILLPAAFRRQMGKVEAYRFVITKALNEQCLELFTIEEWERMTKSIQENDEAFCSENKQLLLEFRLGATEVECDRKGRVLIPERLLKQVEIEKEAVLMGCFGKIEIWSPEMYCKSDSLVLK